MAINNPLHPKDTNLIFFGEYGSKDYRAPYEFIPGWYEAIKRADTKGLRPRDLRHEAVSRFVEAGLGDQEVDEISVHKTMQMLKRYTHLRTEVPVEKLDKSFGQ